MTEAPAETARGGRRSKYVVLLAVMAGSALALLSWTQSWYELELATSAGHPGIVDVPGSVAAPALTALALSGIALAGALSIAGVLLRFVFGALEVLLGVAVFVSALFADIDPEAAGSSAITKATGVSGTDSVRSIIDSTTTSVWPTVAMIASGIMVAAGIGVLVTAARWPGSSRRYQAVAFEPALGAQHQAGTSSTGNPPGGSEPGDGSSRTSSPAQGPPDPVVTWDDLSRGSDPTA